MKCPKCNKGSYPVMARTVGREIYRAYHCKGCRNIFYTSEVIDPTIRSVKPIFKKEEEKHEDH